MATYKQRTPYIRHASADRHSSENDSQTLQTSGTTRQYSSTATLPGHSYHNEATILDKTSDQEWTSIRHTASARARARQQQEYFDQQQQRTREWQFVLGQHHRHTSFNAGSASTTDAVRPISSDEYDEVLTSSSTEPPSHLASPRTIDIGASGEISFEQSSVLGYSDLTSEGLDSVGDSEELDVWSQDDDDSTSLFMPSFRRLSGPASSTGLSPSTSLLYLPQPSFAGPLTQPNSPIQSRFQNQMPLHDGSGNFAGQSTLACEPGRESDHGSESIALSASSVLRQFNPQKDTTRRRVTSSEFSSVIQNIASLQVQAGSASRNNSRPDHPSHLQGSYSNNDRRNLSLRFSPTPTFVASAPTQVCPSNRVLEMYDTDEHELAEMISGIPSKLGWFQAFEQTLRIFNGMNDSGFDIMVGNTSSNNAVKAWTIRISQNDRSLPTIPEALEETGSDSDARFEEVRKNMASASMDTLRRLQMRKRSHSPVGGVFPVRSTHPLDPMQIDFVPTVLDQSEVESSRYPKNRRTTSRSTSTSTSHQDSRAQDSTLLSVFITTLRRLRDHVTSNFIYHDYLDEDDNGMPSGRLGFEGDLGIEWATGSGTGGTSASTLNSHDHHQHYYARRDRHMRNGYNPDRPSSTTPMSSSSSSSTSSSFRRTSNIRRVSSDCGLESMRRYSRSQERMHRPRYVD
ncbi:hypothetical protein BG000_012067 [Podila horticola]|nr:hypothetical protein BG000_012067 [Podila horticola]